MGRSQKVQRHRPYAIALLALIPLLVLNPAADAAGPVLPSEDSFYSYEGPEPLSTISPGTVLQHRTVQLSLGPTATSSPFRTSRGTGLHWMAGRESGYGALDAIRATESYLGIGSDTRVGLSGYSGGSVAANWANDLAPTYAPDVNIVGVAEAGIPANYFNHFAYIEGTAEYSAAIPGELISRRSCLAFHRSATVPR